MKKDNEKAQYIENLMFLLHSLAIIFKLKKKKENTKKIKETPLFPKR
jgi:hypothetical protein